MAVSKEPNIELNVLLGDILPAAIGIAANAFAVLAVIIVLLPQEGAFNGVMFLVGWIGGLAFVIALVHTLVGLVSTATAGDPTVALVQAILTVGLGAALLFMGVREWRKHPKGGQAEPLPKWLTVADTKVSEGKVITPGRATALAFTLAAVNPKAIALALAASVAVVRTAPKFIDTVLDFVVFIAIASIAVAIPVVYRVMGGDNADARLVRWKTWLLDHRAAVTAGVLIGLGVVFVARGLAMLAA